MHTLTLANELNIPVTELHRLVRDNDLPMHRSGGVYFLTETTAARVRELARLDILSDPDTVEAISEGQADEQARRSVYVRLHPRADDMTIHRTAELLTTADSEVQVDYGIGGEARGVEILGALDVEIDGQAATVPAHEVPENWGNLIKAITLLAKGATASWPFYCEHDKLTVTADPAKFTPAELAQLDTWGFFTDSDDEGDCFYSFRYGSA